MCIVCEFGVIGVILFGVGFGGLVWVFVFNVEVLEFVSMWFGKYCDEYLEEVG